MTKAIFVLTAVLSFLQSSGQVDNTYNLMPVPRELNPNGKHFPITDQFRLAIFGSYDKRIYAEASRFIRRMGEKTGFFYDKQGYISSRNKDTTASLIIKITRPGKLVINEKEGYTIEINEQRTEIRSETDIGAIRALETLLQLVSVDEQGYYFPGLTIEDEPRFTWRGLLLDVALHFMPVDVVKRTLDGMAAVKMNVLHLHLSNDQGFRVESKVFPQLQQFASEGLYYTQENIREIVKYAGQRGIRIVPEFVVPAHTTAILSAFPQLASVKRAYTPERYFGVFDPVLDPTNKEVYVFLDRLFAEMIPLFPDAYFHIGGDENTGKDWENTPHIKKYMKDKGMKSFMDLQTEFNKKLLPIITKYGKKMMGWDEILQPGVPKDIVIQSWRGKEAFYESIKRGYKAILSYGYYIDLIQHADFHYLNDPIPDSVHLTPQETALILGGEATMWSELITPETVDSRIWPRLAVIAERLWSSRDVRDVAGMYRRMKLVSLNLEALGLKHLTFRNVLLRKLANSYDTEALEVLVNVIEPLKIYERNSGDTMYTVFSPFTKIADVSIPDPELPRTFNLLVEQYIGTRDALTGKKITDQLMLWKENHTGFLRTLHNSPILKEAELLSEHLSQIAASGLEAIKFLDEEKSGGKSWLDDQLKTLEKAEQSGGRCELQVVVPIRKLVMAAFDNDAKIIPAPGMFSISR